MIVRWTAVRLASGRQINEATPNPNKNRGQSLCPERSKSPFAPPFKNILHTQFSQGLRVREPLEGPVQVHLLPSRALRKSLKLVSTCNVKGALIGPFCYYVSCIAAESRLTFLELSYEYFSRSMRGHTWRVITLMLVLELQGHPFRGQSD